jgi:hypothetical protein
MARETLCDAVESALLATAGWTARVGDEALAELTALRDRFHAGSLGAKPYVLARLTIDIGKARGWQLPSEKVLAKWLSSKD